MSAFELYFSPSASLISVVRRFVSDFYERVVDDPDAVSRVALSTHELLENAVKYSLDGSTTLSITVDAVPSGYRVSIRLSNKAEAKHIAALRALFGEMEVYPDPLAHYQAAMEQTARSRLGSGLGILRVRAEGEMNMSCTIEDATVAIVAETQVPSRRSA